MPAEERKLNAIHHNGFRPLDSRSALLSTIRGLQTVAATPGMNCDRSRIETDRLILRKYSARDFDDLRAMTGNPNMFRYSERGAMNGEESWARLLRHAGHWALSNYGVFAVEDRATGLFVGEAGLCDYHRQLGPAFDPYPEMTWSIMPWAQGRGYATEAARAAIEWSEAHLPTDRTVCLIHADNAPSLRVAEKLGFAPTEARMYRDYPAVLMERPRG